MCLILNELGEIINIIKTKKKTIWKNTKDRI